jgi:hypothetical protein
MSKSVEELIQKATEKMDVLGGPAVLFDREGRILHFNEKARAFFGRPLQTRQDLPEILTEGVDGALENGCRNFFCHQVDGRPNLRVRTRPEYLDTAQPERPTCALLKLEEKLCKAVPDFIGVPLYRELHEGCVAVHPFLNDPSLAGRYQGDPDFLSGQKRAGEDLYRHALRVADILLAVVGGFSGERQTVSVGSLLTEADQAHRKLCQRPMQCAFQGPDGLLVSSTNLRRLRTLFMEVLTELRLWSESATIQWADAGDRLGAPAAKIQIGFEHWPHTVSYLTSKNEGLGFDVAAEIVLDAGGRLEVNPGKPASLCMWLPLALQESF